MAADELATHQSIRSHGNDVVIQTPSVLHWWSLVAILEYSCFSTKMCATEFNSLFEFKHTFKSKRQDQFHHEHWNGDIVILMKFSSPAALEVVKMTTSSAAGDENIVKMTTFSFQWRCMSSPFH